MKTASFIAFAAVTVTAGLLATNFVINAVRNMRDANKGTTP